MEGGKIGRILYTPTATGLVNWNFARTKPKRLWLTDTTKHPAQEGKMC
jgi:hypothetical protein